jgi:hypothetical protein
MPMAFADLVTQTAQHGAHSFAVQAGARASPPRRAAREGLGRLLNILNNTPDRFWLDAHFVSSMTKRWMSVQQTSRAKKFLGRLQTFG